VSTYLLLFLLGGRPHGSWKLKLITPPLKGKGFYYTALSHAAIPAWRAGHLCREHTQFWDKKQDVDQNFWPKCFLLMESGILRLRLSAGQKAAPFSMSREGKRLETLAMPPIHFPSVQLQGFP
jgi:hypothetical protein